MHKAYRSEKGKMDRVWDLHDMNVASWDDHKVAADESRDKCS